MKRFQMLIWLTQLGISIATPVAGFIWLSVWLRERFALGSWAVVAGVVLGIVYAIHAMQNSLKAMLSMVKDQKADAPSVAFNDHD